MFHVTYLKTNRCRVRERSCCSELMVVVFFLEQNRFVYIIPPMIRQDSRHIDKTTFLWAIQIAFQMV